MQGGEPLHADAGAALATQKAAAALANASAPSGGEGVEPMKVELKAGRAADPGPASSGKRSPGSRRNRGGPPAQQAFGMPGMDPATMNLMNMQMMYANQAMASPYMGMAGPMPPWVMGSGVPMFPGMPGGMPMYPLMAHMPQGPASVGGGGCGGGGKGAGKGGKGEARNKSRGRRRAKGKGGKDSGQFIDELADVDDDDPSRSAALVEVRTQGAKAMLTLGEVLPHVLEFARDQHGSRFLQSQLDEAADAERQQVFEIVRPEATALASHAFGNFVVQKLFEVGSVAQRKELVLELLPRFLALSNDQHGCRVVQKAIQHVPRESQILMAKALKDHVLSCIESMHGNHVIQKCIEQMPPDSVTFIIQAVEAEAKRMAVHMYGCRIVQRLLEHCAASQLQVMLDQILRALPELVQDPYGNYVVQHMLERGRKEDKRLILQVVQDHIVEFSKHKCSSSVVEKALEIATVGEHAAQLDAERAALLRKVIGETGDVSPPLQQMMDDRFGNFIVQRMLEHARGPERERLRAQLWASQDQLKTTSHGRRILTALQKDGGA